MTTWRIQKRSNRVLTSHWYQFQVTRCLALARPTLEVLHVFSMFICFVGKLCVCVRVFCSCSYFKRLVVGDAWYFSTGFSQGVFFWTSKLGRKPFHFLTGWISSSKYFGWLTMATAEKHLAFLGEARRNNFKCAMFVEARIHRMGTSAISISLWSWLEIVKMNSIQR